MRKFNLDKLRDDLKIACTITNLLNVMADVEKSAEEYDLKGELYHGGGGGGGGIHQILDLVGPRRERKFIKFIAQKKLSNPDKWKKLIEFLEDERKEREAYVLNKVKRINFDSDDLGKERKPRDNERKSYLDQKDQNSESLNYEKCLCYFCGKGEDHEMSLDSNKKPYIMSLVKLLLKNKILSKRGMCRMCLKPGLKWNFEC